MGPSSAKRAPELSIRTPSGDTQVVTLDADRYELGRAESNTLCFRDVLGLSRRHLAIERNAGNWMVRDLGSTNGTFVNGVRITDAQVLRSKDRVTAGELALIFSESGPPTANQTVVFVEKAATTTQETTMDKSLEGLAEEFETKGSSGHTRALIRAGRELAGHMPLDKLFDLVLDLSVEAVGASRGVLMTLENGELQVRASKGQGFRISQHVRDLVLQGKRSLLVRDAMRDGALAARMSIVQDQIRSMLAVPLQTEQSVTGLIYLDSPGTIREFTKEDLNMLTVMGNIAAVRIDHARLVEIEQAEKVRTYEMEQAASIQRSILPAIFPPFPERKDFELHAAMMPAREIGGDLFDFFLIDDNHLAFCVGDVSGKGVPAALFMAVTRTLLRATAQHHASPAECMAYLNTSLTQQNASGMFVTFFYGVLDTATGDIEYTNAGHNLPYVVSKDGSARQFEEKGGPMLGLFEGLQYESEKTRLGAGDCIMVYTDGITEARSKSGEFFGDKRLENYLAAQSWMPAEQLVSALQRHVEAFCAGAPQSDDITALALRYLG